MSCNAKSSHSRNERNLEPRPSDQARCREARDHNMSSISFNEPGGDKVGRSNGSGTRMAPERASSQATRLGLKVSVKRLEGIGRNLLLAIGEDPTREGLRMTPNRFARWWKELIDYDPGTI